MMTGFRSQLRSVLLLCLCLAAFNSHAQDLGGLNMAIALDSIADFKLNSQTKSDDALSIRTAEIMVYAPIDTMFEGVLSATAHEEGGKSVFEVHEAYLSSSKLLPRFRFRLGQFFLGVGRLNRFHQHDWPFVQAPYVHREFFDDEAVIDKGVEGAYLLPVPFFLELTLGLTSGYSFGHVHDDHDDDHDETGKPKVPTHYLRLASFKEFSPTHGWEYALNYVGRTSHEGQQQQLFGLDWTGKIRQGRMLKWLFQNELWYRNLQHADGDRSEQLGFYIYPQYGFNERWSIGLRGEVFTQLSGEPEDHDEDEHDHEGWRYGFVPTITYKYSEFSTFRLAYSEEVLRHAGHTEAREQRLLLQATFIMGAHPSHDF